MPDHFRRNSPNVLKLMPPHEAGVVLLEKMRVRLGLPSYRRVRLLDYGCGTRFTQAIIRGGIDIRSYTGVDVYAEMMEFLQANVHDRRFHHVVDDAFHPLYRPDGVPLGPDSRLPLAEHSFDVISMFSVITHQYPHDSSAIFTLLRRYVRPDGRLFFSCFLDDTIDQFEDRSPGKDGGYCVYHPDFLVPLVEACGWAEVDRRPSEGPILGDSFVFRPVD